MTGMNELRTDLCMGSNHVLPIIYLLRDHSRPVDKCYKSKQALLDVFSYNFEIPSLKV